MNNQELLYKRKMNRSQAMLLYLTLTAGIASGLMLYSSATTIMSLLRTATTVLFIPLLISLVLIIFQEDSNGQQSNI